MSRGSAVVAACCRYHRGEKRLVNSITFFLFCRQWLRGGCRALAEVAAAAARLRRQAWRWRRQLGGSAILAVAAARLEMRRQRGGGGSNNRVLAVAAWCMLIIIRNGFMPHIMGYKLIAYLCP